MIKYCYYLTCLSRLYTLLTMPHLRKRHITKMLAEQGTFWPVVGLLGLRQSGKSTILRDLLQAGTYVTLDDADALEDARQSGKNFLLKLPRPLIIDEVQKAPAVFDAIKLLVDQKRQPGNFFLTGSSQFSSQLGIRESLTGRIGISYLYPMTLAEAHQVEFQQNRSQPFHRLGSRFMIADALQQFCRGGLPVPLFTRKDTLVDNYFQNWLETTLFRDAQRAYGQGYNPDMGQSIIDQMTVALHNGEYPTLKHFRQDARVLRRYLQAFEDIFLLQKLVPHPEAVGSDIWTFTDTGILSYCNRSVLGEGIQLSLARIFVLKELRSLCENANKRLRLTYFKTARGGIIDLVWEGIPIKISSIPTSRLEYDLRPLRSGIKHLKSKKGILLWSKDANETEAGILRAPWTFYS